MSSRPTLESLKSLLKFFTPQLNLFLFEVKLLEAFQERIQQESVVGTSSAGAHSSHEEDSRAVNELVGNSDEFHYFLNFFKENFHKVYARSKAELTLIEQVIELILQLMQLISENNLSLEHQQLILNKERQLVEHICIKMAKHYQKLDKSRFNVSMERLEMSQLLQCESLQEMKNDPLWNILILLTKHMYKEETHFYQEQLFKLLKQTNTMQQMQQQPSDQQGQTSRHQQQKTLNQLSNDEHDDLFIYKIFNDQELKMRVYKELPISTFVSSPTLELEQHSIDEILKDEKDLGQFSAVKKLLRLASAKRLCSGWSRQLLQVLENAKLENLKLITCPNEADLNDFYGRNGIPRQCLIDRISNVQRTYCGLHYSPLGVKLSIEESRRIPEVHPVLYTRDVSRHNQEGKRKRISINDMIESNKESPEFTNEASNMVRNKHAISLFLIGRPGSGKTTMVKRMVKTYNEDNKLAFYIPLQTVDHNQNWSLKNLLLKFPVLWHENDIPGPEEIEHDFELILANQDKCLIVFDGLDEIGFQIPNPPLEASINDELPLGDLVSLILWRRFLRGARIVTACRPHSVTNISPVIKPDVGVTVGDLSDSDVQILIRHFIPSEDIEGLKRKSPRIYQFIHTPLFLRIFVMLFDEVGDRIWSVNTTAELFSETIKIQIDSANFNKQDMMEDLSFKLGKIAYKKTVDRSTIFEERDLDGLSADDVQDFMFSFIRKSSNQNNASLTKLFQFHHLAIQEYLAAEFALTKLSVDQFKELLRKIFPRMQTNEEGELEVEKDSFMNIRMFLTGLCSSSGFVPNDVLEKKDCFINSLCNHLQQLFVEFENHSLDAREQQNRIILEMVDLKDDQLIQNIRQKFQDIDISLECVKKKQNEAISYFLRHFATNVRKIVMYVEDNEQLLKLTQDFNGKIEVCHIVSCSSLDRSLIEGIIGVLPQLTKTLILHLSVDDFEIIAGVVERFLKSLSEEIKQFDTSSLLVDEVNLMVISNYSTVYSNICRGEVSGDFTGSTKNPFLQLSLSVYHLDDPVFED